MWTDEPASHLTWCFCTLHSQTGLQTKDVLGYFDPESKEILINRLPKPSWLGKQGYVKNPSRKTVLARWRQSVVTHSRHFAIQSDCWSFSERSSRVSSLSREMKSNSWCSALVAPAPSTCAGWGRGRSTHVEKLVSTLSVHPNREQDFPSEMYQLVYSVPTCVWSAHLSEAWLFAKTG